MGETERERESEREVEFAQICFNKRKKEQTESRFTMSATSKMMKSSTSKVIGRKCNLASASSSARLGGLVSTRAKKSTVVDNNSTFRQNLGFTEKDSAGQSNIFAVEPNVYVQSKSENTVAVFAVTALGFAAAFGLGYTLIAKEESAVDPDLTFLYESGLTLSSYEKKFAPPPKIVQAVVEAPAPAVVEEAAPAPAEAPAPQAAVEEPAAPAL